MVKLGNVFILGDSYSTFEGCIPEGYASWYFKTIQTDTDVDNVNQTWWKQLLDATDSTLILNNSWSGTTVCNTGYSGDCSSNSFIGRFEELLKSGFFDQNRIDTFFIFGGTNDSWANAPIGELMFGDIQDEDKFSVLSGFCYLLSKVKGSLPNAKIVCIINTDLKPEIAEGAAIACDKLGIDKVVLSNIDKQAGHPNQSGMKQIAQQVLNIFK